MLRLLRHRSVWGTFFGLYSLNSAWYFLITWFPYYLIRERHFSTERMAVFGWRFHSGSGGLDDAQRLGVGPLDPAWRHAHPGAQDVPDRRDARMHAAAAGGAGAQRHGLDGAIHSSLLRFRHGHIQSLGDHPDHGRPRRRGQMDRDAKRVRQPGGRDYALDYGHHRGPHPVVPLAFVLVAVMVILGACSYGLVVGRLEPIRWNARELQQTSEPE